MEWITLVRCSDRVILKDDESHGTDDGTAFLYFIFLQLFISKQKTT